MKLNKIKIIYMSFLISFFIIFLGFNILHLRLEKEKQEKNENKITYTEINEEKIKYIPLSKREHSIIQEVKSNDITSIGNNKNTLLFFLTSWCPHCIDEIEVLKKAQLESKNVNYIIVSHDRNKEDMIKFLEEHNANFFVLWDPNKFIRTKLNKEDHTVPGAYLLDKNKNIITIKKGCLTYPILLDLMK